MVLRRFEALGGWTLGEVAFLYGLRLLVHALHGFLFGNLGRIHGLIRQGALDRYFVRPYPVLLQVLTERLQLNFLGDLLGGLGLFLAAGQLAAVDWSPLALLYLGLAVAGGVLVEGALQLLVAALAFRWVDVANLHWILDGVLINQFGNYPLAIFDRSLQFLLTFGVPLAFVAYLPATVLLDRTADLHVHPLFATPAPLAGVVWFGLALLVWGRALRSYQSAGH